MRIVDNALSFIYLVFTYQQSTTYYCILLREGVSQ
jgi:hypothetical protein